MTIIRRLLHWLRSDREIDGYPMRISGRDLCDKVVIHHSPPKSKHPWLHYHDPCWLAGYHIRRVEWFVLHEVPLPNEMPAVDKMLNWKTVGKYAQRDTPFPPIVVTHSGLSDGWHRLFAARRRGDRMILVYAPEGMDVIKKLVPIFS